MIAASRCGPSLQSIDVKVGSESLEAIQSLCQTCPNLKSLSLWNENFDMDGDEIVQTVVQHCPLIESISAESWRLSDTSLNALATIHTLKQLQLSVYGYTRAAVPQVLRANPNLISPSIGSVDDALVRCIGNSCGSVKRIQLGHEVHPAYCRSSLVELFRGCPLLESFILHQQGGMPSAVLRSLFESCRNLTELELVSTQPNEPSLVTDPVLYAPFPTLTKLRVTNHGVTTSALHSIITYCTNLQEVTLSCGKQVTDEIVITLTHNCTRLDTLCLVGCRSITIAGMLEVAQPCSCLTSMTLMYIPVNDEVLIQISLHCCSFTRLTM